MEQMNSILNLDFNNILNFAKKKKVTTNQFKPTILNKPIDNVIKELTENFNTKISVKSVPKDLQSILRERKSFSSSNTLGKSSASVIIAPNVLSNMANNPKEKEYVEKTIKDFCAQQSVLDSPSSATGKTDIPAAIVFHTDGSWTQSGGPDYYYKTSDQNNLQDSSNMAMNYLLNQSMNNIGNSSLNGRGNFDNSGDMNNLIALSLCKAYSKVHSKDSNQNNLQNGNNIAKNYLFNQSLGKNYGFNANQNINNLYSSYLLDGNGGIGGY